MDEVIKYDKFLQINIDSVLNIVAFRNLCGSRWAAKKKKYLMYNNPR